jgi:tRNA threonylcarbamoyladenosine biosynthesis protein TsaE
MSNPTQKLTVSISGPAATDRLGQLLAENLPDGSVIALIGTLGAGKTRLVQAVAEQSGIEPGTVSSPTFVLLHEYVGNRPIYHFDSYRLESEEEFRRLGPDDYFEGTGLTFVEWGDKFPKILPRERLEIQIEITGETTRRVILTGYGEQFENVFKIFEKNFPST